jgi:hypothetical protein
LPDVGDLESGAATRRLFASLAPDTIATPAGTHRAPGCVRGSTLALGQPDSASRAQRAIHLTAATPSLLQERIWAGSAHSFQFTTTEYVLVRVKGNGRRQFLAVDLATTVHFDRFGDGRICRGARWRQKQTPKLLLLPEHAKYGGKGEDSSNAHWSKRTPIVGGRRNGGPTDIAERYADGQGDRGCTTTTKYIIGWTTDWLC